MRQKQYHRIGKALMACHAFNRAAGAVAAISKVYSLVFVITLVSGCTSWYVMTTPTGQRVDQNIGERTFGSKIEDLNIEAKIRANFYKASPDYRRAELDVTSYNGIVLLTGTVPSDALKMLATKIAKDTRRVRQVHNKLEVGNNLSAMQRARDKWLTLKVKTKLLTSRHVPGKRIEVITSDGITYLMGLLSPIETKRAVQSISYMEGLKKIVKVVEYVTPTDYAQTGPAVSPSRQQDAQLPRNTPNSTPGRRVTLP
jgi:osmotically-inducible protein OsmY